MKLENYMYLVPVAAVIALIFAAYLARKVGRQSAGTERMKEIAAAIAEGARAFLTAEYKILIIFVAVLFVLIGIGIGNWVTAICFVVGALFSTVAGYCGMTVATKANVRTANAAKESGMNKALSIAFSGGAVMGMCVAGLGALGVSLVYIVTRNVDVLFGFSLGASSIALFARVGGGIYTKAADVGADLVGKVEAGIPEDDPRNPAVIADNVGDNVGDIAGMGSDLCESYVGALVSAISLGVSVSVSGQNAALEAAAFPFVIAALGVIASVAAQLFIRCRSWENPQKALSIATYVATGFVLAASFAASRVVFDENGPFFSVLSGLIVGILIGKIAEYYTSDEHKHVKEIAHQSQTGHATNIISGFSIGMQSTMLTVLLLGAGIVLSYLFFGMYGIALGAVGMLSTTGITVSVDAIMDRSQIMPAGIAEMAELEPEVRSITDRLDSVGNTTAAIGKGFCIGSAAFTALAMIVAFAQAAGLDVISLLEPGVIIGLMIGAMLPYFFTSLTLKSVGTAAKSHDR